MLERITKVLDKQIIIDAVDAETGMVQRSEEVVEM